MVNRKLVRSALQAWKRSEALGEHPLAGLRVVEERQVGAGYADTRMGRGLALRDVLRDAIEALRPNAGLPDPTDDRWRPFIILTQQYVEDQPPGYVAEQLSIAQSTYHHAQADALDTLAAILREQEYSADRAVAVIAGAGPLANASEPQAIAEAVALPGPLSENGRGPATSADDGPRKGAQHASGRRRASGLLAALAVVLVLVGLAWVVFHQRSRAPDPVVATIPFPTSRTTFVGANPTGQRIYVALEDMPGIAVIDGATNAVLAKVPTQGYHRGLAVHPATNRIYVAQQFDGSVRIIDGADQRVVGDLPIPDLIQTVGDVAVNPTTDRLYVIRANNNDVAVFDTATNAFLGAVAFGPPSAPGCPTVACDSSGIAVNPATNRVYIANPASNQLTVIDGAANKVLATVAVGKAPSRIGINLVTNTVYVTNSGERSVSVVDGASQRLIATIPVETGPIGIAVNPATNRAYVGYAEHKTVSVIDGASNLVVAAIPVAAPAHFFALLPAMSRVYVTTDSGREVKVIEDAARPFAAWLPLEPSGGPPPPRGDTAGRPLGYDPSANRLVVFGGMKQGGPLLNDTWVLANADGTTGTPHWSQIATANPPPPRRSHAGAYDAASNRLITYGGCLGGCTPIDDKVYVLSHANGLGGDPVWEELHPAGDPPPLRNGHSAVYDPTSNRLIVFGGDNCCGGRYNDVWVLTHANGLGGPPAWIQLAPQGEPPAGRVGHSAVYDTAANRMLVFGGAGSDSALNDTWVLSGANGVAGTPTWTRLAPIGALPTARSGHSAVYDAGAGQMLIFGGGGADGLRNDIWALSHVDGRGAAPTWTPVAPSGVMPTARTASSAVYRAVSNRLVVFGGNTEAGSLNDTWVLINVMPP